MSIRLRKTALNRTFEVLKEKKGRLTYVPWAALNRTFEVLKGLTGPKPCSGAPSLNRTFEVLKEALEVSSVRRANHSESHL